MTTRPIGAMVAVLAFCSSACGAPQPSQPTEPADPEAGAPAPPPPAPPSAPEPPAPLELVLAFKLDPRLSGPTYGGERWVSPPTYMGASGQDQVEVRVEGVTQGGGRKSVTPDWTTSDPSLVTITPTHGARVTIGVKRPGESRVTVSAPGVSKELIVTAREAGGVLLVQIVQLPTTATGAIGAPARASAPTRAKE
jgi:hypothetical protein